MDVKERFKLSGLTVTLQRIKIYEAIKKLDHPTPEEILNNLKDEIPSFSVSAVYSNLSLLLSHKLISKIGSRYDINLDNHYHVICTECDKIIDFYYPSLSYLERVASSISGVSVEQHDLLLYGKCSQCKLTTNSYS
ncbi:Fur family transcriptional regulator [Bacillus cereus]|uniref:Fur family transcriptional regulator n=1 Tax=Bacillus cereus TaxID=1396 RepID=UPI000BF6BAD9|nr:Fur family transcriptional regulator [Bacillus cereus]PFO46613.1 transcriptional repressor [Bacillus cereus]UDW09517.1 transcriptional repressor [Bacillus cereus]